MSLGLILVIILVIFFCGGLGGPWNGNGPFYGTGMYGGGGLGLVVLILIILLVLGRI
jgi:hypothetical protein